jgi:hypothetical protein
MCWYLFLVNRMLDMNIYIKCSIIAQTLWFCFLFPVLKRSNVSHMLKSKTLQISLFLLWRSRMR